MAKFKIEYRYYVGDLVEFKISEGKTDIPKEEYVQCGQTRIILYPQENN